MRQHVTIVVITQILKMQFITAFAFAVFALLLVSFANALDDSKNAQVLRYDNNVHVDGYNYAFETSNGIKTEEEGHLNIGTVSEGFAVEGSYSYTAPDGQVYTVYYKADKNGFQPQGAHLPTV